MAQKYSFRQFLTGEVELIGNDGEASRVKIDKISIPMIQRDYAQGRKFRVEKTKKTELNPAGKKFIQEIFSTLLSSAADDILEMDFVYGSIAPESDKNGAKLNVFSPLDGQQRLTTLFLLYWFIGGAELPAEKKQELSAVLHRFVYLTRRSSTDFCRQLVDELGGGNIKPLLRQEAVYEDNNEISPKINIITQIKDIHWFHDTFQLDPTVVSMLNMLEEIQALYIDNGCQNIFERLERLKFYILPLSNFDLTEDLYVKMNARGKQLTDFENFKADLQDWLKKHAGELAFEAQRYDGRALPYDMFFINKVDNEWSQCFWDILKEQEDKNFDPLFLKFFYRYLLNEYILHYSGNNRNMDKEADFNELLTEDTYLGFSTFEKHLSQEVLENLVVLLDNISAHYDEIVEACQPSWAIPQTFNPLTSKLEQKDRTVFCALVLYLTKKNFDKAALSGWMRVVWNIVENADIDSWRVVAGVMQLILELAAYSDNIYALLADDTVAIASLQAQSSVAEERLKAKLIQRDPAWLALFLQAEAHPFFKGSIRFLIPDDEAMKGFRHNYEMAKIFFEPSGIAAKYRCDGHIFLRALISQYQTLSTLPSHMADADEKEHSLKKMLSSDDVVRAALGEWFSLAGEDEISAKLREEVSKPSPIPVGENDFDKKLHEKLYRETDLINWMQEKQAIRYKDGYISRPNSSYDWVYVYGYRNEIISELRQRGWQCENRCHIGPEENQTEIPYFWSAAWRDIEVTKTEELGGRALYSICVIGSKSIVLKVGSENFTFEDYHHDVTDASKVAPYVDGILSQVEQMKKSL